MKYYFFELLACPMCRSPNLKLYAIEESEEDVEVDVEKVRCKRYCSLFDRRAVTVPTRVCSSLCVKRRIDTGVIVCVNCGRWYPIVKGIPVMLDDKYRDESKDREFVEKYLEKIPDNVRVYMRIPSLNM